MMKCPVCLGTENYVRETRALENGSSLRRRRECMNVVCKFKWSTYEDYSADAKEAYDEAMKQVTPEPTKQPRKKVVKVSPLESALDAIR